MKYLNVLFISLCCMSFQTTPMGTELSIQISNLESNKRQIILFIYSSKEGFPTNTEKALKKEKTTIINGTASFSISYLPAGEYNFYILHDENMNEQLDSNLFGLTSEGLCVSNNVKDFFGPPSYKDLKFNSASKNITTDPKMKYL